MDAQSRHSPIRLASLSPVQGVGSVEGLGILSSIRVLGLGFGDLVSEPEISEPRFRALRCDRRSYNLSHY